MTDVIFANIYHEFETISDTAKDELIQAGFSEDQAKQAAEIFINVAETKFDYTYRYLSSIFDTMTVRRRRSTADIKKKWKSLAESNVKVEIKRIVTHILKNGKQKTAWGVEFTINNKSYSINFGSKDRTMLYICTLLRAKVGENMYKHEFFNNSRGKKSKFKRAKSRPWLKEVFNKIFPTRNRDFEEWIGKIEATKGRPLNQGKTQANNSVADMLKCETEAMPHCLLKTKRDKAKDSFYHLNLRAEDIIIPQELQYLIDRFYELTGTSKTTELNIKE